jgi:hypothetical protein
MAMLSAPVVRRALPADRVAAATGPPTCYHGCRVGASQPHDVAQEAQRYGRYRVVRQLGAGAMGAVYLARDEQLGREVALKTARVLGLPAHAVTMYRERFANEARAVAALSHPHIVQLFDADVDHDTPFLVMEVVRGASLKQRLGERGPLPVDEAQRLCAQIGSALVFTHARGIVHRDIKPANILDTGEGCWKLADFGVAHTPDASLTITGQFLGTPAYAAPEAVLRGQFGAPSDVFGLAATLYAALCGAPPFGDQGFLQPGRAPGSAPPPVIADRRSDVPPAFARLIEQALALEPESRPTAAELAACAASPRLAPGPAAAVAVPASFAAVAAPTAPVDPTIPAAALRPAAGVTSTAVPAAAVATAVLPASATSPATLPVSDPTVPAAALAAAARPPAAGALPPPAPAAALSAGRGRQVLLAGAALLVLLIIIAAAQSGSDGRAPGSPAGHDWSAATPGLPGPPAQTPPDRHARREYGKLWSKVQHSLNRGDHDGARDKLEEILERFPDDPHAAVLLQQLAAIGHGEED